MGTTGLKQLYRLFKKGVKHTDSFSTPIYLTYKGEQKYKTIYGGLTSILLSIFIFLYTIYLFNILITRGDTSTSTNTEVKDLYQSSKVHEIGKANFAFAFAYRGTNADFLLDSQYFTLKIVQKQQRTDANGNKVITEIDLGVQFWGDTFPYSDKTQTSKLGIAAFFCPKTFDYSLSANQYSDYYETIEIRLERCSAGCGATTIIDNFFVDGYFELVITNSYFDFNDYDQPVKQYLEQGDFSYLITDFAQLIDVTVRYNEASMSDNYFSNIDDEKDSFYSIGERTYKMAPETSVNAVFQITFRLDEMQTYYARVC